MTSRALRRVLDDERGLDFGFPVGDWFLPAAVQVQGDLLVWSGSRMGRGKGPLPRFLALSRARPDTIANYARQYGVLGFCAHGRLIGDVGHDGCRLHGWDPSTRGGTEPLEAWRYYSRQAGSLLDVAARVRDGRPADRAIIEQVMETRPWESGDVGDVKQMEIWLRPSLRAHRDFLLVMLASWLAHVRPQFRWVGSGFSLAFGGRGLIGTLAVQLALAASGQDLAVCSGCRAAFVPRRRPRADQRAWCENCTVTGAHWRAAQRDCRARRQTVGKIVGEFGRKTGKFRGKPKKA